MLLDILCTMQLQKLQSWLKDIRWSYLYIDIHKYKYKRMEIRVSWAGQCWYRHHCDWMGYGSNIFIYFWLCETFKMIVNWDDEERITKGCELRCNLFRHKSWSDTLQALSHPPAPWLDPRLPNSLNGTNEPKIMNFLGEKWAGNNGLFWVQFLVRGVATPPIYWAGNWSIPT